MIDKKQLLEEFTEGLEILFLKRGRGSKIYSSDLDRTLKFFTQAINRVEKAEMTRIREWANDRKYKCEKLKISKSSNEDKKYYQGKISILVDLINKI